MKLKIYKDTTLCMETELINAKIPEISDTISIGSGSGLVKYVVVGIVPMWDDGYVILFVNEI